MKVKSNICIIMSLLSLVLFACNNQSPSSGADKVNRWGDEIAQSPTHLLIPQNTLAGRDDSQSYDRSVSVIEGQSFTNFLGMKMIWIDSGKFLMGRTESAKRMKIPLNGTWPVRTVTIENGFWIAETELTQWSYEQLRASNPSQFKGSNHPVDSLSWKEASQFCRLLTEHQRELNAEELQSGNVLTYLLPSEAQWEYACRAGSTGVFYSSELPPLAWYFPNSSKTTHRVKGKVPNAWGLFDMLGNVEEWCSDDFAHTYHNAPLDEQPRQDIGTVRRVVRGGSFSSRYVKEISSSARRGAGPSYRYNGTGFRPVMVMKPRK